jgi:hypothetical protein
MFAIAALVGIVALCVWFRVEQFKQVPGQPPSQGYVRSRLALVAYAAVIAIVNLALGHLFGAALFAALAVGWSVWLYRRPLVTRGVR